MRRLLISALIVATLISAYLLTARPHPRVFYQRVGISESRRLDSYRENRRSAAPWTRDPSEVALLLVEGCNHQTNAGFDCNGSSRVEVFLHGEKRASVVVLDDPVRGDDSIAAEEWRLDLFQAADGGWEVEWSGLRWRCQRELVNLWTRFSRCS